MVDKSVTKDDFDFLVCSTNFIDKLTSHSALRLSLGQKFPSAQNGTLGDSGVYLCEQIIKGSCYSVDRIDDEQFGMQFHIGRVIF